MESLETEAAWAGSVELAHTRLITLFAKELQLPEADVDPAADFFALGGHSVSAGRIIATIRKETGVRVGLIAFFEDPTVQRLANLVVSATPADR